MPPAIPSCITWGIVFWEKDLKSNPGNCLRVFKEVLCG